MSEQKEPLHTCSAYCHLPDCIKWQRDRMREWVIHHHGTDSLTAALMFRSQDPQERATQGECTCTVDQTTGWTDDKTFTPRCNVCGLVVAAEVRERAAQVREG